MREPEDRPINQLSRWGQTRRAFAELRADYHGSTKAVTSALAAFAVLGTLDAYLNQPLTQYLGLAETHPAVRLEKALISDPFLMLLTLLVALFVGIALKRHQLLGKLDGADHYTIGRALAYGYFKNFLVGALLVVQAKGEKLHVFKPGNVDDLKTFEDEVWPKLQPELKTHTVDVTQVARFGSQPLTRRIIVVSGVGGASGLLYFDFPTTLFTVADYYEAWNEWCVRNKRPHIAPNRLAGYQQQQINDFFRHLHELVTGTDGAEPVGPKALQGHGLSAEQLQELFRNHLVEVSLEDLKRRLGITAH